MPVLGGFCPMPLRLDAGGTSGWSPEQHARLSADLCAAVATVPLLELRYTKSGATITVNAFKDQLRVGKWTSVSRVVNGTGDVTWQFATRLEDEFGRIEPILCEQAKASCEGSGAAVATVEVAQNTVRVRTFAISGGVATAADKAVNLKVWSAAGSVIDSVTSMAAKGVRPEGPPAIARRPSISNYGGATDKVPAASELVETYAYQHFVELATGRGSLYTQELATQVGAENVAIARCFAALSRAAERLEANALPLTAHEALGGWIARLNVTAEPGDDTNAIRDACAARYRLALGPTRQNEDESIATLLGPALVQVWRQEGTDLATPPPITYWPTINPGPASHDLTGAGAWLSEREHLVVEVEQPPIMELTDFLRLLNVRLFDHLDSMLPSTATFDWCLGPLSAGFLLDISALDFTGIIP